MASLNMFLAPATAISSSTTTNMITTRARRVQTFATAAKGSGGSSEEKGFLEWLAGALQKDGFVETDPILQKVDGKSGGTTTVTSKKTATPAAPPKKEGGFGGLFAKK
ncbi:hypothetical protein L1987_29571 [Smallanthus sonchifolius]|uniref:Uncharacterized protein n=1 Tax=Smallanthus sonchifolius TaxID=185202 RepID=A0ACB9I1N2_9ASTR|nr:hypothetical protein L1987_29571 [Smallanthus sonchifolius]